LIRLIILVVAIAAFLRSSSDSSVANPPGCRGKEYPDLHVPAVFSPHIVQRMTHAPEAAHPRRLHQRLKGVLPVPRDLLQVPQARRRFLRMRRIGVQAVAVVEKRVQRLQRRSDVVDRDSLGVKSSWLAGFAPALAMC
jgi:hypothetical protein